MKHVCWNNETVHATCTLFIVPNLDRTANGVYLQIEPPVLVWTSQVYDIRPDAAADMIEEFSQPELI
jgi:hypothetical protein